jgi:hypothetical protein
VSVNDRPSAAAGTGANNDGTSTGSTGHEATNTDAADLASAGHEKTDRSGYTDLASVPVPNAQVLVTVPVFSLLGLTDEPANLDGYGPIPASMARKLVTDGASSFYRVLVDPRDGAPLEIGRTSYRLTKAMKKALQLQGRQMHLPRLQQPLPRQRHRPPHRLAPRRNHRNQQPGTALPQTPPPQTQQPLGTHPSNQQRTTRLDLTHRPTLQTRTTRPGTTTMATRATAHGRNQVPGR